MYNYEHCSAGNCGVIDLAQYFLSGKHYSKVAVDISAKG
jgi:hypothetical protein